MPKLACTLRRIGDGLVDRRANITDLAGDARTKGPEDPGQSLDREMNGTECLSFGDSRLRLERRRRCRKVRGFPRTERSSNPPRLMSPRPMKSTGTRSRLPKTGASRFRYFPLAMLPSRITSQSVARPPANALALCRSAAQ